MQNYRTDKQERQRWTRNGKYFIAMRSADDIEGSIQILSSLWGESVIESQCDIAVQRINIIEISQSVYDLLLGRHFYLNDTF